MIKAQDVEAEMNYEEAVLLDQQHLIFAGSSWKTTTLDAKTFDTFMMSKRAFETKKELRNEAIARCRACSNWHSEREHPPIGAPWWCANLLQHC